MIDSLSCVLNSEWLFNWEVFDFSRLAAGTNSSGGRGTIRFRVLGSLGGRVVLGVAFGAIV